MAVTYCYICKCIENIKIQAFNYKQNIMFKMEFVTEIKDRKAVFQNYKNISKKNMRQY